MTRINGPSRTVRNDEHNCPTRFSFSSEVTETHRGAGCLAEETQRIRKFVFVSKLLFVSLNNFCKPKPDFPSHLRAHTLTEELAAAQKKLKGYEDLCTCKILYGLGTVD